MVDVNYLKESTNFWEENKKLAGAVFRFEHQNGNSIDETNAITDYELFMRYYKIGLKNAKSPYAYYSLGSAISCPASAYIKAGGMREKNGGEDFYFMQALRKTGNIGQINSTYVSPASRFSDRVPFGTGPKIKEIIEGRVVKGYHPKLFSILKSTFEQIEDMNIEEFSTLGERQKEFLAEEISEYLTLNNFKNTWMKIYQNTPKTQEKLSVAFHTWFDAFRTLKFIHFCEEHYPKEFRRVNLIKGLKLLLNKELPNDKKQLLEKLRKSELTETI